MKNTELIKFNGKQYLVDFDKMKIFYFSGENDFENYKVLVRNPTLSKDLKEPKQKFIDKLLLNSKTYDPNIHKFLDDKEKEKEKGDE